MNGGDVLINRWKTLVLSVVGGRIDRFVGNIETVVYLASDLLDSFPTLS